MAKSLLKDIAVRARIIEVDMPGELNLNPSSRVNLSGTNTSWDQLYYIDEITRSLSFGEGFKQHLRLKNHSSGTQTTVF